MDVYRLWHIIEGCHYREVAAIGVHGDHDFGNESVLKFEIVDQLEDDFETETGDRHFTIYYIDDTVSG